jgi:hypothetical protein
MMANQHQIFENIKEGNAHEDDVLLTISQEIKENSTQVHEIKNQIKYLPSMLNDSLITVNTIVKNEAALIKDNKKAK